MRNSKIIKTSIEFLPGTHYSLRVTYYDLFCRFKQRSCHEVWLIFQCISLPIVAFKQSSVRANILAKAHIRFLIANNPTGSVINRPNIGFNLLSHASLWLATITVTLISVMRAKRNMGNLNTFFQKKALHMFMKLPHISLSIQTLGNPRLVG